jgi:hypothetical protein
MQKTTPIHINCGTCTECARNSQIVKYKCIKGGSYQLLNGYVGCIDDCCIKPRKDILLPLIVVSQLVGAIAFWFTYNPLIGAVVCFVVSAMLYLFIE